MTPSSDDKSSSPQSLSPQQSPSPSPSTTKSIGRKGEQIAYDYLVANGYAIMEQNWKCGRYELDIVAQKGTRIIFVEVKTRKNRYVDPVRAVDNAKRQRTIKAADVYLQAQRLPMDYQFDIIAITNPDNPEIEHIPDAFFPTPNTRHKR